MRILIVGAGALGGYFGARLLAAGRDVTFLLRPATAKRIAAAGLHIVSPNGDVTVPPPPIVLAKDLHEPFDLILLSCKAYDLADAMDSFAPAVGPGTAILPLLNGMAHMAILDARFGPEHVLGGMSRISALRAEDGTIHHFNKLDLLVYGNRDNPQDPRLGDITAALTNAGFEAQRRDDITQAMWDKWITIATAAGSTCTMRANIGEIVAAGADWIVRGLIAEAAAIATSEGFPPAPAYLQQIEGWFTQPGSDFTASMLRDLESGAPVESHQILGDLLDHAQRQTLDTPLLKVAHAHVRCYEERRKRT